jgi:nucleoside-diphosphate-sugar epimerase
VKIALTVGTGYIGSHILADLRLRGHEVIALVRDDTQAASVKNAGATPVVTDLYDFLHVVDIFSGADGAIHTASPGDQTSADLDAAVVDAAISAFGAAGKPYAHISGLWVFGSNLRITEESSYNAPPLVAWKEAIERRILAESGMRGIVIVSGSAYGDGGGGIPGILLSSPRDADGNLIMLGDGSQHWVDVHVADLAAVFRLALEKQHVRGKYAVGNGMNPTVAELTGAAARAAGAPGSVPGSVGEARNRLGDHLADVLLLDQATTAAKVRATLGWKATRPTMTEELRTGSYAHADADR